MKILIVKTSALGDIVHALPAASYLKEVCPGAQIHWLVEEAFTEVLEPLPYIERVIPLNMRKLRKGKSLAEIRKLWETLRFIRGAKYDIVLDLQGNTKSGFFTLTSGAAKRFGFGRNGVREWPNLLTTNRKISLTAQDHHISDRSLAIAREAVPGDNIPVPETCLQACEESRLRIKKWLAENNPEKKKIVVCHTGTTWKTKLWPQDNWDGLLRWMIVEGSFLPLLTWGNEAERITAQSIIHETGGQTLLWPGGTLGDLTALLSRADLVIGSDTGPVHMAAALGTPTVSFYRVTDSSRNGPRGPKHICLQAPLDCSPCLLKECPRDDECGHSIHLKEALKAVERQIFKS
jgi:lipopolysaccharide heptosyltransferase I